jgi:hypothetical protein
MTLTHRLFSPSTQMYSTLALLSASSARKILIDKTRQGYERKHTLKLAGYFFLGDEK